MLRQIITDEIQREPNYAIPFSHYMELALYHPVYGYYNQERKKLGREGDFFTNAHVGQIYGRVLANLFCKMWHSFGKPTHWALVEIGAGDGRLAEQVITGLLEDGMNPAHFSFYLVETSPYHRQMQKQRLAPLAVQIEWKENLPELPRFPYSIIYSNELIDAFPVHRIKRTGKFLYEGYVTIAKDALSFIEKWGPLSTPLLGEMIEYLQVHLYEEHVMELNLAAYKWIHEVAQWMDKGFLLTIDYGARSKELLLRKNGTLRCYQNHQLIDNPYHMPGELDLTSHVNFEFLEKWGEECGLKPVTYQTQSRFLLEWGILDLIPKQPVCHPFSPEAKQGRAIQQLIHPYGMGEVFQVLLQAKGLEYSFLPHSFL